MCVCDWHFAARIIAPRSVVTHQSHHSLLARRLGPARTHDFNAPPDTDQGCAIHHPPSTIRLDPNLQTRPSQAEAALHHDFCCEAGRWRARRDERHRPTSTISTAAAASAAAIAAASASASAAAAADLITAVSTAPVRVAAAAGPSPSPSPLAAVPAAAASPAAAARHERHQRQHGRRASHARRPNPRRPPSRAQLHLRHGRGAEPPARRQPQGDGRHCQRAGQSAHQGQEPEPVQRRANSLCGIRPPR